MAMTYKDILVHLDNHHGYHACLQLAVSIARQNKARLVALYRFELPQPHSDLFFDLAAGPYAQSDAERTRYERERDAAFGIAQQIEAAFRAEVKQAGLTGIWRTVPEEKPKDIIAAVTEQSRYADLVVLGRAAPDHPLFDTLAKLPERVMMESGRPVLIVPPIERLATLGKKVLVAWKGTREAARAVADALPLLKSAEAVTVLTIGPKTEPEGTDDPQATRLIDHLAQHDIRADAVHIDSTDVYAAQLILARATALGCGLIVMGGYGHGHSRTRELMLGGVTHALLQDLTVPVLMSH
jgi:nucleotide-binding universal stress UspA family protein